MELSEELLFQIVIAISGGIVVVSGAIIGLIILMWRHINLVARNINIRLQSLVHEDRDIRSQLSSVMHTLVEYLSDEAKNMLKDENSRLRWMLKIATEDKETILNKETMLDKKTTGE